MEVLSIYFLYKCAILSVVAKIIIINVLTARKTTHIVIAICVE